MKKLFISCPMSGRTNENIKETMFKMHQIAQIIFNEKLQTLDGYFSDDYLDLRKKEDVNKSIYFLGRAIQKMSEADYFIGVEDFYDYGGCEIEHDVAMNYGIPMITIPSKYVAQDARNEADKRREKLIADFNTECL